MAFERGMAEYLNSLGEQISTVPAAGALKKEILANLSSLIPIGVGYTTPVIQKGVT